MNSTILLIWETVMYALIALSLIFVVAVSILATCRSTEWNNRLVLPWEKAELRDAKKKEKAELRARREFWQYK